MKKCPSCKSVEYKKNKHKESAFEICGIKGTELNYFKYYCQSCKHSELDTKSLNKSRQELVKIVLASPKEEITRDTLSFLMNQVFSDSLFLFSQALGQSPSYLRDVMKANRPLTEELSVKVLEASFLKSISKKKISFVID